MSIRVRILGVIALLGLGLAALLLNALAEARHGSLRSEAALEASTRGSQLVSAAIAFAAERGETVGLLANRAAATPTGCSTS